MAKEFWNKVGYPKSWKKFIFTGLLLFFLLNFGGAEANNSSDAIAIRVIPNFEHYSAKKWYANQSFSGSPQSLTVDGYEAIRDGRTVYVNVGNVAAETLYTNIYLITYNQDAEALTTDIFARILKHWRFNTNVSDRGHCRGNNSVVCILDKDCPINDFCDSYKSRVIRDVKRLENLADIRDLNEAYYKKNGTYPLLSAGTYLPQKTLSVWPSWQETFAKEIGRSLPQDPINKLGKCCPVGASFSCNSSGVYNEKTCWDENRKIFSTNLPGVFPHSSLAYVYSANQAGNNYVLCGFLETGLSVGGKSLIDAACPEICIDMDYDGFGAFASAACPKAGIDCDDTNPAVGAGSTEICNDGIDNDCDGFIDCSDSDCSSAANCQITIGCNNNGICEAGETSASCPSDCPICGDGFCSNALECPGKPSACPLDCACGNGRIDCAEECDGGANCNPNCTLKSAACTDADGDRYIKENTDVALCGNVCGNGTQSCLGNNDCNDNDPTVYPGAPEICNGIDNNCDGTPDSGFTAESCGYVCLALDSSYDYNPARAGALRCCGNDPNEGGPYEPVEVSCSDGRDNDCDGRIDEEDTDCLACNPGNNIDESFWYIFGQTDCNQCDHEGDDDGNQSIGAPAGFWNAYPGMADKCDAACGIVATTVTWEHYEHGIELSCDGIDNNCDGNIDEGLKVKYYKDADGDGYGDPLIFNEYCPGTQPANFVNNNLDCDDTNPALNLSCVMNTYCLDADGDGFGDPNNAVSANSAPAGYVSNCTDCNDDPNNRGVHAFPGNVETCDNLDNNCDGQIDEGCDKDGDGYCNALMKFYNYPVAVCPNSNLPDGSDGDDCNDNDASIFPGAMISCGIGACANSVNACVDGVQQTCTPLAGTPESTAAGNCDDGIDNDCDGLADYDDPDCTNYCIFNFEFPCILN